MSEEKPANVTMRVRIGQTEIEVTGPSDFVERKINEFLEKAKQAPFLQPAEPVKGAITETGVIEQIGGKEMSVAQFFRKISAKTDVDRVLAAGYFLEKIKDQDSYTASEISSVVRSAKIAPPRNANDAINKNIKKGYMMPSGDKEGKMAFVLTTDGEDAITGLFKA
jgi:hypothetical protein